MAPSSPAADLWTGRLVGGRWRIVSLLDDSGGMASVYLADDERLPRKAVVKIPRAAQFNAEFAERFSREAFWHAQVENLHVVHILDRGEEEGVPFLVLQYLPGGNLKAWCGRNASILSDPRLHYDSWLLPIAQALDAVAAQGIVHRDVKPSNILFDAAGQAYLSDFGIVKAGGDATMTGTGMFIGTLQFMSPEQCDDDAKATLDGRSDQYGLAVTVYQVLTGWKYPVDGETVGPIFKAKLGLSPLKTPRDRDRGIPEAVNDAVMRGLSPDRDKRFASSVEFAQAVLEGFGSLGERRTTGRGPARLSALPPDPPTARPVQAAVDTAPGRQPGTSPPTPPGHPSKRSRRRALLAGIAAACVAAAGFAGWWSLREPVPQREPAAQATVAPVRPASPEEPPPSRPVSPAPRVTSLSVAASPGPGLQCKAGDDLTLVATFSRPVHVTGQPRIGFRVGSDLVRRDAVFVRGDGSDELSFLFEVPRGGIDTEGIALDSPAAIDLAGGSITDAATDRAAEVSLSQPESFQEVRIDGVSPRVFSVEPPRGTADRTTGNRLTFRLVFNEPVEVEGEPQLVFKAGDAVRRAGFAGMADPESLEFAYTVAAGDASEAGVTATALALSGGSIRDRAGNPAETEFAAVRSPKFAINLRPEPTLPPPVPAPPAGPKPGDVQTNSLGMKLVGIRAGEFEMSSNQSDDEKPVHRVQITKPFWLGQTEVTQGQFERVMGATPWRGESFVKDGPTVAASYVSWDDAVEFCRKLTEIERRAGRLPAGGAYRLPTEAEWEYACRAGTKTKWSFGDEEARLSDHAWFYANAFDVGEEYAHEVGRKKANPWGLFDMHGNVYEWCSDWYDEKYYAKSPAADPKGPSSAGSFRVFRGGGWNRNPVNCRSANRLNDSPASRLNIIGFRVVLSVE